jgi:hypothetical protein
MKLLVFLFFLLGVVACSSKTEKVVTLDELNAPSEKYQEEENAISQKNVEICDYDSLSLFSKRFIDTLEIPKKSIRRIKTALFPDRFNPIKSEKWVAVDKKDSLVYQHWKYSDSVVAENTFYNYLDNFGTKKIALKFGDKYRISANAFVLLLQDRSMVSVESRIGIDLKKMTAILDTLGFGSQWKLVLFQQKGKKSEWFEKLNLNKKNESSKP